MNEDLNTDNPSSAQSSAAPEKDSVLQFIESAASFIPPEKAKVYLRATPTGLFVQKEFLPSVMEAYRQWFYEKTQHSGGLSESKVLKRFFASINPPLCYLVESKQCMVGYLVPRKLIQPQLLNLPVYIGSVDDTRRILHPRDPLLQCMQHLTVARNKDGQLFALKSPKASWSFSESLLRDFSRTASRSNALQKEFSDRSGSLRDSLRVLASLLEKAVPAKDKQRLLVPHKYRNKPVKYIAIGSFTFVIQQGGVLGACYEVGTRTLFRFVKSELISLYSNPAERIHGQLELCGPRNRSLAVIQHYDQEFRLHPKTFCQFVRGVMKEAPERSLMPEKYSIKDCILEFVRIFQSSERIEKHKIQRHVSKIRCSSPRYIINGRWIFVLNRKNIIMACVDRFH